jgi:PhnB protein
MRLSPYLNFNGQSEAAFKFYERCLGGKIEAMVTIDDPADAERIFNALAENGAVKMPIQQTFWAACFGMPVDQFGVPWMINCENAA